MAKQKAPIWKRLKKTEKWIKYNSSSKAVVKSGMAGKYQKMHEDLAQNMVDNGWAEFSDAPSKIEDTKPSNKKPKKAAKAEKTEEGGDK